MKTGLTRTLTLAALALPLVLSNAKPARAQSSSIALTQLDFQGNIAATDKMWFYRNSDGSTRSQGGGQHPSIELVGGRSLNVSSVVYPRGRNLTLGMTFTNGGSYTFTGNLAISGARLRRTKSGAIVTLGTPGVQSFTIPARGQRTVSFTLTNVPNYVTASALDIKVDVRNTYGTTMLTTNGWWSPAKVLFTYDVPQGLMSVPWTEVVEMADNFADGGNSASVVSASLTQSLFDNATFRYQGGALWIDTANRFKLSAFLSTSRPNGNCVDVSNLLSLCASSLGVRASVIRLYADNRTTSLSRTGYRTNYICAIGKSRLDGRNYERTNWQMHQVTVISNSIYDACASQYYDLFGRIVGQNPAGWYLNAYWQTAGPGRPMFYGLVDGLSSGGSGRVPLYIYASDPVAVF